MDDYTNKWLIAHGYSPLQKFSGPEGERLFPNVTKKEWFFTLSKYRGMLKERDYQPVTTGSCEYYDCARVHRSEHPQPAAWEKEDKKFCASCASLHEAKIELNIPEPLPHEIKREQ